MDLPWKDMANISQSQSNYCQQSTLWLCLWLLLSAIVAAEATCSLRETFPSGCVCDEKNITCDKVWPGKDQIPQGVVSLTITGCNKTKLGKSRDEFGILKDLSVLNLTDNKIFSFTSPSSFHHKELPRIQQIILDNNNLSMNYPHIFNGLSELEVLSLRYAFNDSRKVINDLMKTFVRSSFQNLRELHLDNNDFGLLGTGMFLFDGGKESVLEVITLRNCSLKAIQEKTFMIDSTPYLSFLDLSMNSITTFDKAMNTLTDLGQYGSQLTLDLTNNTFTCNCNLEEFRNWLNTTSVNVLDRDSLVCYTAFNDSLEGRSILSLKDELECTPDFKGYNSDNQMKLPYIILSIIFGVIGFLFLIIMYMRRIEIQQWIFATGSAIKEVFCSSRTGYSDIGRVQRSEVPVEAPNPAEV